MFRPKDLGKGYRKVIENAIKDLHPDTKDTVIRLLLSEGIDSEEKLKGVLGQNRFEDLLKILREQEDDT
ncbi:MAG: hypothetical protein ACM3X1_09940 [Ignavibacteriales bacterium]